MDFILLPKLNDADATATPQGGDGEWYRYPFGRSTLLPLANTLVLPQSRIAAERIKSTPNPWARALLFEQALFADKHPAHQQILGEWRGLLATVGLAGYLGVEVVPQQVPLKGAAALEGLRQMLPRDSEALWNSLILIRVRGNGREALLGATSPRTVLFTGVRSVAHGVVPFEANGRLIDPTEYYRRVEDPASLAVLYQWIEAAKRGLELHQEQLLAGLGRTSQVGGDEADTRYGHLMRLFDNWRNETNQALKELGASSAAVDVRLSDSELADQYPESDVRHALLSILYGTVRQRTQESNVLHVPGARHAVMADPADGTIRRGEHAYNGRLRLPAGQVREVADGVASGVANDPVTGAPTVNFGKLFEPAIIQIVEHAPEEAFALRAHDASGAVDYLYPFKPEILDHISTEQLRNWSSVAIRDRSTVVSIDVPIGDGLKIRYEKVYRRDEVLDGCNAPSLVVWPDFESPSWSDYFFASHQVVKRGSRMQFAPAGDVGELVTKDAVEQGLRWGRTSKPVEAWVGEEVGNPANRGLLLTAGARRREPLAEGAPKWDVAIDFGSTQTRVFQREQSTGASVSEVALKPRTRRLVGTTEHLPFFFFPAATNGHGGDAAEKGVPTLLWAPLGSALPSERAWLPSDGHVFWGVKVDDARQGNLTGDLKWRRDSGAEDAAFMSFVTQVFTSITAEAMEQGARVASIITAYPGVLPRWLQGHHDETWRGVAERFGVEYREPLSESDAVVEYLLKTKKGKLAKLLAVDIGGSTADFAVWYRGSAYLDSLHMAGSLFNRLIAGDPDAREAVSAAARPIIGESFVWTDNAKENRLRAGLLLRKIARTGPGNVVKFGKNLYAKGPGSPGERVLGVVAYLYAVVGFSLGAMAARLGGAGEDNYDVFFAGRGAELLNWLDAYGPGSAKELVSVFVRAGLRLQDPQSAPEINVRMPNGDAKEEVGRGLLLAQTDRLTTQTGAHKAAANKRITFFGEDCYGTDAKKFAWNEELTPTSIKEVEEPVKETEVEHMRALRHFMQAFQETELTQTVAETLGISPQKLEKDRNLRDLIHQRVFYGSWRAARDEARKNQAVIEPFFVTEAKALLDHVTGLDLFSET